MGTIVTTTDTITLTAIPAIGPIETMAIIQATDTIDTLAITVRPIITTTTTEAANIAAITMEVDTIIIRTTIIRTTIDRARIFNSASQCSVKLMPRVRRFN